MSSHDFILVVEGLLDEIRPLKEQFEMMADEHRSGNEEFRKAQLEAIKERTQEIDNLVSQLDSIVEADEEERLADAATSGGRRKTKKKHSKNKKRRNKKSKTRRKKGGDAEKAAFAIKAVKDTVGRLLKTKDDIEKAQEDKTFISDTKRQLREAVSNLKKAPGAMGKKLRKLGNTIKKSFGPHSACLAAALLAQEGCILKNIKENDPFSASGSRGYVSGTDAKPSSLMNTTCSVRSLQKIIPNWDIYKSKKTQFGCGEKIRSDMIEISGLKNKENERQLMENPQHVADLARIRNRQQELKERAEKAEETGRYVVAEGKNNIFEDEEVVLGGRRKTKRRRNKKKRKTKKKRRRRRKKN
tara:strand:- start:2286 stop:3356 length:1071 start_codon:yes stop_codon:yes gene_type:complete